MQMKACLVFLTLFSLLQVEKCHRKEQSYSRSCRSNTILNTQNLKEERFIFDSWFQSRVDRLQGSKGTIKESSGGRLLM